MWVQNDQASSCSLQQSFLLVYPRLGISRAPLIFIKVLRAQYTLNHDDFNIIS